MPPKFGTSGLRGLAVELTDSLIAAHVRAFASVCDSGGTVCIGRDLRDSSPRIAAAVGQAARKAGLDTVDCGLVPTPALAMAALDAGAGAIMVTGSHIPADRNGLKFYTRAGEITKQEEAAITAALSGTPPAADGTGRGSDDPQAGARFAARYVDAFGAGALTGRRIGIFSHSAVGRDLLADMLRGLGAVTVELGRSDTFIPVDTEAVDPAARAQLAAWTSEHDLHAIASTDGDSDRPMLCDEKGRMIAGDVLGQIVAETLGARTVVTPVSSNTGAERKGFDAVIRTRIGSPHVIAAMQDAMRDGALNVAGYEANGGFLLGFAADAPGGTLSPLMTRDSFLPIVAAGDAPLSQRVGAEPARFTATDRVQDVPTNRSLALVARLTDDGAARSQFAGRAGLAGGIRADVTDGLRLTDGDGNIIHLRPSGNAPELRVYAEADTPARAETLLAQGMGAVRGLVS
ncbi:Phosphoglucomutase/phosphomannomutase [Oceaniovalibus guishaninsula JLT2003]|uniref:Phosphoglucomutase/phosphomannomutase n=1 Tax=Oceaniovalibus guishaninsula JLT2003 TaxID=1231392 RepID=K2HNT2_9RHOB|nr:phosphomannomutase [Oceaniovalibus guishaninsula]EKE44519.1 Phosphoglucomutase/phosphomannomutase [Oceaniovalibus guishaninsula JLT2003]